MSEEGLTEKIVDILTGQLNLQILATTNDDAKKSSFLIIQENKNDLLPRKRIKLGSKKHSAE